LLCNHRLASQLLILQPLPPEYRNYRYTPPCSATLNSTLLVFLFHFVLFFLTCLFSFHWIFQF
jgi:hypothetical protein